MEAPRCPSCHSPLEPVETAVPAARRNRRALLLCPRCLLQWFDFEVSEEWGEKAPPAQERRP